MKRIHFFASKNDIQSITDLVESTDAVKYILAHHHFHPMSGPDAPIYETARDIPDLGVAAANQTVNCARYLVVEHSTGVTPMTRHIGKNLPDGGKWYTAYEAGNCRECVEFNAGGFWSDGTLINGLVQTWSDDPAAQRLMRRFAAGLKKNFVAKINVYWIGREANEFLKNGGRLTFNSSAPPEFNIKIPE
ncbi:hypothetical protein EOS_11930 [Caballeronia mineralivorans PML1(12)]|uniref:Uncharacterized protein n=1 Tax=Caballeronia mineralivorans PML1(12) TaxID=908627 RepID=A0A0J1CZJ8_9BURK|nr:hypothetical protein [Caballeronia mineralivorans]KLU25972.1 hypothetical protein EOS_11930 [Caballeronia mineralivorans PML1(12)]